MKDDFKLGCRTAAEGEGEEREGGDKVGGGAGAGDSTAVNKYHSLMLLVIIAG